MNALADAPPLVLVLDRPSAWEDAFAGARFSAALGVLLYPLLGLYPAAAGEGLPHWVPRGLVASLIVYALLRAASGKVKSRVVLDSRHREVHEAVRIGDTDYLGDSWRFDQAESLLLVRDEIQDGPGRGGACRSPEASYAFRLELKLSDGAVVPLSTWVREDDPGWSRFARDVAGAARALALDVQELDRDPATAANLKRSAAWIVALALTAGLLVVLSA